MKNSRAEGARWLDQARHDLEVARDHLDRERFSDACFMAEQAAQKALKSALLAAGERFVLEHSVARLAEACAARDAAFGVLIDPGKVLDQYYIPTRYPDALAPPAVPYRTYTQAQAREAVGLAASVVDRASAAVGGAS